MDPSMKIIQWQDKRTVSFLTTIHGDNTVSVKWRSLHNVGGCEVVEKPEAVTEYNKFMEGSTKVTSFCHITGSPIAL